MIQLGGRSVLSNRKVSAAILVVIANRRAAPVSIDLQPAFPAWHGDKTTFAIAAEKQSSARINPAAFPIHRIKILRQEDIFMAVAIEIADTNAERRSKLRFDRKRMCFEMIAPIEENHAFQGRC